MNKTNFKIGLNIIFDKSIYDAIDFALRNNFSTIELWSSAPQFFPEKYSKKERSRIAKYAKAKNIQIQFHASASLGFFDHHSKIRKAYFDCQKEQINFARDIRVTTFTVHPGRITVFTYPPGEIFPIYHFYPKYFLKVFKDNLEKTCNFARNKVDLCIENASDAFQKPVLKIIQGLLDKDKLFLTWDIAKSYKKDGNVKKEEIDFFLKNIKKIKNVHVHDSSKIAGHQIIGKGFVDFNYFFDRLKDLDINYIIEVRPHSNVIKSRDNLFKILK